MRMDYLFQCSHQTRGEVEAVGGDAQGSQAEPAFRGNGVAAIKVQVAVQHGLDAVGFQQWDKGFQRGIVDHCQLHGAGGDGVEAPGQAGHFAGDDLVALRPFGVSAAFGRQEPAARAGDADLPVLRDKRRVVQAGKAERFVGRPPVVMVAFAEDFDAGQGRQPREVHFRALPLQCPRQIARHQQQVARLHDVPAGGGDLRRVILPVCPKNVHRLGLGARQMRVRQPPDSSHKC